MTMTRQTKQIERERGAEIEDEDRENAVWLAGWHSLFSYKQF
jgi:hypothetical protein